MVGGKLISFENLLLMVCVASARSHMQVASTGRTVTWPAELEDAPMAAVLGAGPVARAAARRLRTVPRSLGMWFMTKNCTPGCQHHAGNHSQHQQDHRQSLHRSLMRAQEQCYRSCVGLKQ